MVRLTTLIERYKRENLAKQNIVNEQIAEYRSDLRELEKNKNNMFIQEFEKRAADIKYEIKGLNAKYESLRTDYNDFMRLLRVLAFLSDIKNKISDTSQPQYYIFFSSSCIKNEISKTVKDLLGL